MLNNTVLTHLDITKNDLTAVALRQIVEMLEINTTLLSIDVIDMTTPDYGFQVLMVGDGLVGKTSLYVGFKSGKPTVEFRDTIDDYIIKLRHGDKIVQLNLKDIPGQDESYKFRSLDYPNTDLLLVCFSLVNPSSFENITAKWIPEIQKHCPQTPFLLVGTKADLLQDEKTLAQLAEKGKRPITDKQAEELARQIKTAGYVQSSAYNKNSINKLFQQAAKEYLQAKKIEFDFEKSRLLERIDRQLTRNKQFKDTLAKFQTQQLKLVHTYLNLKKYTEAIDCCNQILQFDKKNVTAWGNKGIILWGLEKYIEAIEYLNQALRIDKNSAIIWCCKGDVLCSLEEYTEAVKCYNQALRIDKNHALVWRKAGNALEKLNKPNNAIECYDQALQIDNSLEEIWWAKLLLLLRLRKFDKYLVCCNQALLINKNWSTIWYMKGFLLNMLGRKYGVIECCDQALQGEKNLAIIWRLKGDALEKLGSHDEAVKCYEQAQHLDKHSSSKSQAEEEMSQISAQETKINKLQQELQTQQKEWLASGEKRKELDLQKEAAEQTLSTNKQKHDSLTQTELATSLKANATQSYNQLPKTVQPPLRYRYNLEGKLILGSSALTTKPPLRWQRNAEGKLITTGVSFWQSQAIASAKETTPALAAKTKSTATIEKQMGKPKELSSHIERNNSVQQLEALLDAIRNNDLDNIRALLKYVDVNARHPETNITALHQAVAQSHNDFVKEIVELLLAAGANPNLRVDGETASKWATSNDRPDVAKLIEQIELNRIKKQDQTVLNKPTKVLNRKGLANLSQEQLITLLKLSDETIVGTAIDDGGCGFDALAQCLGGSHTEKSLRLACHKYYLNLLGEDNKKAVDDWIKKLGTNYPNTGDASYLLVQYMGEELKDPTFSIKGNPTWFTQEIDGRVLCHAIPDVLPQGIHVIEITTNPESVGHYVITKEGYSQIEDEDKIKILYALPTLVVSNRHFVPLFSEKKVTIVQNYPPQIQKNQKENVPLSQFKH